MNTEDLKKYLSKEYQGSQSFLENIIYPIFGEEEFMDGYEAEILDNYPEYRKMADTTGIRSVKDVGMIYIDGEPLQIFDISVSDRIMMERNRVTIQSLVRRIMDQYSNAFMLFHYEDISQWNWRFTYCHKSANKEESTDSKRYTFLLGPKQSCRTAAENFVKLYEKRDNLMLVDIEDAFSVEALSDRFFNEYKEIYANIIFYITGKRMVKKGNKWEEVKEGRACRKILDGFSEFDDPEKAVRDYVKKLMGRLVFLQFLQKKGWLGVPSNKNWGEGDGEFIQHLFTNYDDQDNFIDDVLEKLFNDLNTERKDDISKIKILGYKFKVPYLNGGLFERDATDETYFPLPARYMEDMLEFFSRYNFTIDENDPDDAEVGVDPEMLGRIFENLLEDNKDKGAFYTPKEIVTYMCRESLIAYLQTGIEDEATKEALRQFVTTHDVEQLGSNKKFRQQVDEALKNVKICDPAIGSGAFPMGLLKELFLCRTALEGIEQSKAAEIKKHIIQQNIYGVDIEKGAVDIARLRFWLSLIVDEKKPQALPNLDYKIVEGNSLITTFDGSYINLTTNVGNSGLRSSLFNIRPEKRALQAEQKRFFTLSGEDKYRSEIAIKNHILNIIWYQLDYEKQSWENATIEQADMFGGVTKKGRKKNTAQVMEYTPERRGVLEKCEKLLANLNDENKSLQERASISIPFFEWEIIFSDIFDNEEKKGFDIVIGNPPYVSSKVIPVKDKQIYKNVYITAVKQFDLYSIFIEHACNMLKEDGITSFIIPDSFIGRSNFEAGRKIVILDRTVLNWEHINNVFESADVSSLIYVVRNKRSKEYSFEYHKAKTVKEWASKNYQLQLVSKSEVASNENLKIVFASDEENNLLKKIRTGRTFDKIFIMWRGEELGRNSDSIRLHADANSKVLYTGKQVRRYCSINPDSWIRVSDVQKSLTLYSKNKILIRQLGDCINATINTDGGITTQSVYSLVLKEGQGNHLEYYLGLLNSTLFMFIYRIIAGDKQLFKRIILENIKKLSLPNKDRHVEEIKDLVSNILRTKRSNPSVDTSTLESEIDLLVYHLYDLTYDEVLIVDPETTITREEFESKQ